MARLALLVTGASGMLLPRRFLATVTPRTDVERIHLVVSAGASRVLRHELDGAPAGALGLLEAAGLSASERTKVRIHRDSELDAEIASGSYRLSGTIVLPCSSSTLASLALGIAQHLVQRAGAVALKEGWPLVLGFRETPLALVHLENLRRLLLAGAVVLPPIPAFYAGGESLERFADAYVLRILDHLGLPEPGKGLRWEGPT